LLKITAAMTLEVNMNRAGRKDAKDFCASIAPWRRDLGLTQLGLANLVGVSVSLISAYERGAVLPDFAIRQKINLALEDQTFRSAEKLQKRIERARQ